MNRSQSESSLSYAYQNIAARMQRLRTTAASLSKPQTSTTSTISSAYNPQPMVTPSRLNHNHSQNRFSLSSMDGEKLGLELVTGAPSGKISRNTGIKRVNTRLNKEFNMRNGARVNTQGKNEDNYSNQFISDKKINNSEHESANSPEETGNTGYTSIRKNLLEVNTQKQSKPTPKPSLEPGRIYTVQQLKVLLFQ